ncbi:MAG TPA: ribosome maturation factor RimM [Gemmatimonadales bacterium]|nr:ribosome maturation factor RimM [Gemmatimonadales bacterium]
MTDAAPPLVAVGRLRKPHGLKGEMTLFPLTDDPAMVLAAGRTVWVIDLEGRTVGGPLEIERSRSYHRAWLLKFRGVDERDALDPWRDRFLGAPAAELAPPADGEVYLHELEGFAVKLADGTPLGLVSGVYDLPAGVMLEVQGPEREFLLPFKREFVREVDRAGRRLVVALPDGLLDL